MCELKGVNVYVYKVCSVNVAFYMCERLKERNFCTYVVFWIDSRGRDEKCGLRQVRGWTMI